MTNSLPTRCEQYKARKTLKTCRAHVAAKNRVNLIRRINREKFVRRTRHSKLLGCIRRAKLGGHIKPKTCKAGKTYRRIKRVGRVMHLHNCRKLLFGFLH